jgi:predicted PhzF superfamily epimerase YddE/YHI9
MRTPTVNCPLCGHAAICSPCEMLKAKVDDLRFEMLSRIHDDGVDAVACEYVAEQLSLALGYPRDEECDNQEQQR